MPDETEIVPTLPYRGPLDDDRADVHPDDACYSGFGCAGSAFTFVLLFLFTFGPGQTLLGRMGLVAVWLTAAVAMLAVATGVRLHYGSWGFFHGMLISGVILLVVMAFIAGLALISILV